MESILLRKIIYCAPLLKSKIVLEILKKIKYVLCVDDFFQQFFRFC